MDFELNDEQRMLRDVAREFVRREIPPERAKELDERGSGAPELIAKMRELGWFSLGFPESEGGSGGGPLELCVLAEELGRASLDVAMLYILTLLTSQTAFRWADDAQKRWLREEIFSGRRRLSVSISEPESGSDAAALSTRAELRGDHFVVSGVKAWCTGAGQPHTTLATYVRTSPGGKKHDGLSLLLIDAETPGVEIRKTPTLARNLLGTNEVFLTDVVVPRSRLYGPLDGGWAVLLSNLELERVLMSGAYVGSPRPRSTRRSSTRRPAASSSARSAASRRSRTRWPTCRPRSTRRACSRGARRGCWRRAVRCGARARWRS